MLGIWWRHEILISEILNLDFLENQKSFELKIFFQGATSFF